MNLQNDVSEFDVIETDSALYFWRAPGWPGNWPIAYFELDGQKFNCTEQAMMYMKAILFNDLSKANEIIKESDPKKHKKLGSQVKNFVEEVWTKNREDIMYKINLAKYSQNPELKKRLLSTGNKILVEASPLDKIWGIGKQVKNIEDAKKMTKAQWNGLNLLGKALEKVRETLSKS
jgi:ribA/ribD-fused uncharacterized protein